VWTNQQPERLRLPSSITDDPEIEQHLRDSAWQQIVRGDDDADEYVEWMTDGEDSVTAEQAEAAFAYVRAARVAQQAPWTDAPTNLTRAFDALADIGILARQNFSCCGTCAAAEIWDELDDTRTWRGYMYFHLQDTDGLVADRSTYVGYGTFLPAHISEHDWNALSDDDKQRLYTELTTSLMNEARKVLSGEGIGWEWNGDLGTRILLTNAEYFVRL
jgi:hypothetical protein